MTAINHIVSPEEFEKLSQYWDIQKYIDGIRAHLYALTLERTEDLRWYSPRWPKGSKLARDMMDVNIATSDIVRFGWRSPTLLVPQKIFSEISADDIANGIDTRPHIYPMLGDKDVFMLRTRWIPMDEVIWMNERIKELYGNNTDLIDPIFEWICFDYPSPNYHPRPELLVEWMNKPFRRHDSFQNTIVLQARKAKVLLDLHPGAKDAVLKDNDFTGWLSGTPLQFEASAAMYEELPNVQFHWLPKDRFNYA